MIGPFLARLGSSGSSAVFTRPQSTALSAGVTQSGASSTQSFSSSQITDERIRSQVESDREALTGLQTGSGSIGDSRRSLAREKANELKKRIEMLKASGADPKTIARAAAQMARELKAAMRASGGDASATQSASDTAAASTDSAATAVQGTAATDSLQQAQGPAVDGAIATIASESGAATVAAAVADAASVETTAGSDAIEATTAATGSTGSTEGAGATTTAQASSENGSSATASSAAEAYQKIASARTSKATEALAEWESRQEIKRVSEQIQTMMDQAIRKLREKNKDDPLARETEREGEDLARVTADYVDATPLDMTSALGGGVSPVMTTPVELVA